MESKENTETVTSVNLSTAVANGDAGPKEPKAKKSDADDSDTVGSDDEDDDDDDDQKTVDEKREAAKDISKEVVAPQSNSSVGHGQALVFYLWSDAITSLLGDQEEDGFLVLKSKVDALWAYALTHKGTENERYFATNEMVCELRIQDYPLERIDDANETPEAKKLKKLWKKDVRHQGDWWYEITLEKQKPESGRPALKVDVDGLDKALLWLDAEDSDDEAEGGEEDKDKDIPIDTAWWIVDIAAPSKECDKGVSLIADSIWDGRP